MIKCKIAGSRLGTKISQIDPMKFEQLVRLFMPTKIHRCTSRVQLFWWSNLFTFLENVLKFWNLTTILKVAITRLPAH